VNQYETFDLVMTDGPLAEIRLNKPEKNNRLSDSFWKDFPAALELVDASPSVRVLLISSTGTNFCAGMDLDFFQDIFGKSKAEEDGRFREWLQGKIGELQGAINRLETIKVPVIAVVQGACVGGALDLICAANIRFCTSDAYFSVHETNVGMTADLGSLQRLPTLIPMGLAHELAFTGRKFKAEEARPSGLVNGVFDSLEEALNYSRILAALIAEKSPLAIRGVKKSLHYARDHSVADGLDQISTWNSGMFVNEDVALAIAAQQQRTTAVFKSLLPCADSEKLRI